MELHKYEVGTLYHQNRTEWPERTDWRIHGAEHELRLFLRNPSPTEIRGVRKDPVEFGFLERPPVVFLLFRFLPSMPWSDQPFHWKLQERVEEAPDPAEVGAAEHATATILLINAATGILEAIRYVSLSPSFSRSLHQVLWRQIETDWPGEANYQAAINAAYLEFTDSNAMANVARKAMGGT